MLHFSPALRQWSRRVGVPAMAVGCVVLGTVACQKKEASAPGGQKVTGQEAGPAHKMEPVETLEDDLKVQVARTTSNAVLPWVDATPTTADGKPATGPQAHQWASPTVLIGREEAWINDKPLAKIACIPLKDGACTPEAVKSGALEARFEWAAGTVVDGKIPALVAAGGAWQDQRVVVLADRRTTWQTVHVTMETLRSLGAKPVLAAGSFDGALVDVLGAGTALPEAATLTAAKHAANPGSTQAGGLPDDATSLTIDVGTSGASVLVGRKSGEPARPEVLGSLEQALIAIVERLRLAAPSIQSVTVRVDPAAGLEEVVRVIDGVRDDCARTGHGQGCTSRTQLMATIGLELLGAAPAPAAPAAAPTPTEGGGIGLRLGAPGGGGSPGELHLGAAPAGIGLRLGK